MKLQQLFKYIITLCVTFFCVNNTFSQSFKSDIKYTLESGTYLSTSKQIPFWLRANQYGVVPLESQILTFRGALHKEYDSTKVKQQSKKPFLNYGYGLNTVINIGRINQILLPEAYLKIRYKAFELYGGRRKEIFGLVDSSLTSGSYIWSGNALPMPKIQISIPNYISIIGKGLISIKGGFTHGWFSNGYVKNYYLHQKWFYGYVGKPNWKMKFFAGFNHQVQWGGRYSPPIKDANGLLIDKLPSDLNSYLKVISGLSVNKGDDGSITGKPLNEAWNRIGNHLGTVDIGVNWLINNNRLFIYRQSIYDDGSLFYLNNIKDGLFGISFKKNKLITNKKFSINSILLEYLNTKNQGGETGSENTIPQLRGLDNYFNNSIYLDGWSYKAQSIGTPFFLDKSSLKLSDTNPVKFRNTRVQSYILSLSGNFNNILFISKFSKSINYGTYFAPLVFNQNNIFFSFNYIFKKQKLALNIEYEKGYDKKNQIGTFFNWTRYY